MKLVQSHIVYMFFKDIRKHTPDSLEEFKNSNYTLMLLEPYSKEKNLMGKVRTLGLKYAVFEKTDKFPFTECDKVGYYLVRMPITYDRKLQFTSKYFEFPIKYIKEDIMVGYAGLAMPQNDVLYKTFRHYVRQLFEAGILKTFSGSSLASYLVSKDYEYDLKTHYYDQYENTVLSVEILKAGFIIWIVCVIVAILSFIGELLWFHSQNKN